MKEKVVLDSCSHKGQARLDGHNFSFFCMKCMKEGYEDEIHSLLKCNECPDYEPYEYEMESTETMEI